jgi:acyl carrier protein
MFWTASMAGRGRAPARCGGALHRFRPSFHIARRNLVDREEVLLTIHKTATEFVATNGREIVDAPGSDTDNLVLRYGFTSLDSLEFLLVLEEKFGITLEDEDMTEEVLSSAGGLADYILAQDGLA